MKYVLTATFATDVSNEQQRRLRNKAVYWLTDTPIETKSQWAHAKSKLTVGREGKYAHLVFDLPKANAKRAVERLNKSMTKVDGFVKATHARV